MREATRALLRSAGIRATCYRSAEGFLRSPRARTAGCLVLDLRLPGISGLQLHCRLRDAGLAIPSILLTAERDPDKRVSREALAAGMLAVLPKPSMGDELVSLLRQAAKEHES